MIWQTDQYSSFLYRGGFVLLSIATVLVRRRAGPPGLPARAARSAGGRCAGSACAPTGSTSGTSRSSSSPPPSGVANGAEPAARRCCRSRRSSPSRRSPGSYVEEPIRHGALGRFWQRPRARRLAAARPSRRGAGPSSARSAPRPRRRRAPAWPASTRSRPKAPTRGSKKRVGRRRHAKPAPLTPAQADRLDTLLLQSGGPHRRLDLRGTRPRPNTCRSQASGSKPSTPTSAPPNSTCEISGARSIEEQFEGEPNAQEVARSLEARRLQRLLGAGARHQRGGQRLRRLHRRRARTDRNDDGRRSATNR